MKSYFLFSVTAAALMLSPVTSPAQDEILLGERYRSAEMQVVYATGFYEVNRNATLSLNYRDENLRPESITLTIRGRKLKAQIWNFRPTRCGDRYYARLNIPNQNIVTDLLLVDYSNVRCRLYVREKWHATISTKEPDGSQSDMELVGNPNN